MNKDEQLAIQLQIRINELLEQNARLEAELAEMRAAVEWWHNENRDYQILWSPNGWHVYQIIRGTHDHRKLNDEAIKYRTDAMLMAYREGRDEQG